MVSYVFVGHSGTQTNYQRNAFRTKSRALLGRCQQDWHGSDLGGHHSHLELALKETYHVG